MEKGLVKTYEVTIKPHPNENIERLEIAHLEGTDLQAVVGKGQFNTGDTVAFIHEGCTLPDETSEKYGIRDFLAGPHKNRVKAVRLGGAMSYGICVPVENFEPGVDLTSVFGAEKYRPQVPGHLDGVIDQSKIPTIKYKIHAYRNNPHILQQGEHVVVTEKIHGTWACYGMFQRNQYLVTSKGYSNKGLSFNLDSNVNSNNVYVKKLKDIKPLLSFIYDYVGINHQEYDYDRPPGVYVLGEIYGVQDLKYGKTTENTGFRIFDIFVTKPMNFEKAKIRGTEIIKPKRLFNITAVPLSFTAIKHVLAAYECQSQQSAIQDRFNNPLDIAKAVPILYEGPFKSELIPEWVNGQSLIYSGHMREGCVIKAEPVRYTVEIGRAMLKTVSEKYLTRKKPTEYN